MKDTGLQFSVGEFVCTKDKDAINYQAVLDDFANAKQVRILTYNISKKSYRNYLIGEKVEFEVSGDKIESVYMIPGWTHNIINLSDTEDLVTVMTCNEIFNPNKPDTFHENV